MDNRARIINITVLRFYKFKRLGPTSLENYYKDQCHENDVKLSIVNIKDTKFGQCQNQADVKLFISVLVPTAATNQVTIKQEQVQKWED